MASRQVKRILAGIEGEVERAVGRAQLRILQAVTAANPVLTGWSRAGWTPNTGSPPAIDGTPPAVADVARAQAASLFAEHLKAAELISTTYKIRMGPVYLSNAVPYIRRLNEGWSAQAPTNFVEIAITVGLDATRRELAGR